MKRLLTARKGFLLSFNTISLQRKLLFFVVVTLSLIFTLSGIYVYKLLNDSFMEAEHRHLVHLSESLAPKVGVWYFVNKESGNEGLDHFLRQILTAYDLEYITFKDTSGALLSEIRSPGYIEGDRYNLIYAKTVHNPSGSVSEKPIGMLEIAYNNRALKEFSQKYFKMGMLLVLILILYFYMERRLLKGLLNPLRVIAAEIKGYMPGDKLVFESFDRQRNDEISEIVHGFRHMQHNIDDAIKRREAEEANNRAKDAFLLKQSRFIEMGTMINNIAHQWKQPLNIIELGITDLTVKSMMGVPVDPDHQQKIFGDIHKQVAYMSKTIDIFKNFLDDNQNTAEKKLFSLKEAIEETLQLLGSTFDKKQIALILDLDEKVQVYGSSNELEQALLVILNNAADTHCSEVRIECGSESENIFLKIYDNGGGFDPAIANVMFDAYFTTKHQSQGTGLGLFIAKTIIEIRLNGTIEAHNTDGGALFMIRLPFPPDELREAAS